ncbi:MULTISPECIES: serine O-acetyltransferase EpsC [unclassified Flavobacterium]|uniref:serine O-acetyltransferase EpsC n=1 Tax=unclassified Flavobacterium TaxID=196869 RepID=UPI000968FB9A|nr:MULTISPECIES: serine O-acetyltransferase EpsC [unclassified Flavobacterium]MBN9283819.1 serine acetyltransferase [Flavobacterium sp.]OJV68676.1 MAG: serine acetyltransferase [Flavobacterium sp. 40-81]
MAHPIYNKNRQKIRKLPDKAETEAWVEHIFQWLFSIGEDYSDADFFTAREAVLKTKLEKILNSVLTDHETKTVVKDFFNALETIHSWLEADLEAVFNFDPAAKSRSEVLVAYPGFFAIAIYRLAHQLWKSKVPVVPRLISEYVHSKTGIDIHPGAKIGERFFIDHGTGIVIGETTVIGNDVKIYQGVTLGALHVSKAKAEEKRHPTIGNNVIIYANATILGGNTEIGNDAIIGGNVWITNSIPKQSLVYHKSEIVIKNKAPFPEPLNFVI